MRGWERGLCGRKRLSCLKLTTVPGHVAQDWGNPEGGREGGREELPSTSL
jgi:hypothetical protein